MTKLYRGYIYTKQKRAIMPFKDKKESELLTFEQVSNESEYAGVLADDTVLIDIDERRQADILLNLVRTIGLKCKVYSTSRGAHFLFKNDGRITKCSTHTRLGIGLEADIKVGDRNSYHVLKFNGKVREVLYDSGDYQIVPRFLTPVASKIQLLDLGEGDGRNQALFGYILPLQTAGYSNDEIKECIRLINEYILKSPLSDTELKSILREEAFGKPMFFGQGGKFLHDKFANYLRNSANIIKLDGRLHVYKDGIYVAGEREIESRMIAEIPNLTRARRAEVLSYLDILVGNNTKRANAEYIAFQNGVYNIKDNSFEQFSPELVITNKIECAYNPNAYSELMDSTLNKLACYDEKVRMLLEECIGYCFYARNELGKAFILVGDGSNGKSTFIDFIKSLLGEENISSLDIKELGDRFKSAELFGKMANLGDDIADEFIADPSTFKKLVTGDRINAERKGCDPFEFNNYAKLLFSANNIPRIKDKTGAVQRRLVIIPFDAVFSKNDPDYRPYIKYELREQECLEYIALLGLNGLRRVLEHRAFTESDRVEKQLRDYELTNNPIVGWLEDVDIDSILNEPTKRVYLRYSEYCLANNLQPMSNIEFSKVIKKRLGVEIVDKRVDGVKYRVFVKK